MSSILVSAPLSPHTTPKVPDIYKELLPTAQQDSLPWGEMAPGKKLT
jgi:hypothetical protein